MNVVITILVSTILLTVFCIAVLAHEQKDKQKRRANGLPARRYYDVTDYDVRQVITVNYSGSRDR